MYLAGPAAFPCGIEAGRVSRWPCCVSLRYCEAGRVSRWPCCVSCGIEAGRVSRWPCCVSCGIVRLVVYLAGPTAFPCGL